MIKSIKIINYGPFKNESINLESGSLPINIIGMNDVGKTALLNAVKSSSGLNKKYGIKEDTKINIIFKINKKDFNEEIIEDLRSLSLNIYEDEISVCISSAELKKNPAIFTSNNRIKCFFEEFLSKINENLSLANQISINDMTDKKISEIIENINNKSNKSQRDRHAEKNITLLLRVKEAIYKVVYNSVISMSADSRDHFDYIKSTYILKDTTNDNGEEVRSDWGEIEKFLNAFFLKEDVKKFNNIIFSDSSEAEKRRQLKTYEEKMSAEMNGFFQDHFPSQNSNLKFSFDVQTDNKIYLNVKDDSTEYMPLNNRSDGFKWFLKMFILLRQIKNNNTILIDEPEKFLHASAQKELVKLFQKIKKENDIQIIYATHSPFMLQNDFFPTIKIISKNREGSKIYNNVNAYINSNDQRIKEVMTPIANALGVDLFELTKLNNLNHYLFVEGEADLYSIKIAKYISGDKSEDKYFIWPLTGDSNSYGIYLANLYKFSYKLFLDGEKRETGISVKEGVETIFLSDLFEKEDNIKNPEDMLEDCTKNKYEIDIENDYGKKISNHKKGWQKIYDDLIRGQLELNNKEKENLKNYWKKLKNKIK